MKKMTRLAAAILCAAFVTTFVSCANAADSSSPTEKTSKDDKKPENEGELPPEDQGPVTYKVNISTSIEHGSVTASPESAAEGTEITLTATADQGYLFSSYSVTGAGGAAIAVSEQGKFTMPASDVTVSAVFVVGVNANLSNFPSTVQALTQDSTIAMTGQLTSGDLAAIKSALQASQYMIKLDLRGVTGLDSLPQGALDRNPKLQSLSLPEGLASIGHNALTGCENLESLYLPASFSSFDELAFEISPNPNVFTSINVAEGNLEYSSVDGVLFSKDKKTLVSCPQGKSGVYTVPAGVTTIGPNAFDGCRKLTGIVLPEGLQEIVQYAFRFTNIASMTIPSSVITIYNDVFSGNTSLTSLTFDDAGDWYSTNDLQALRTRSGGTAATFSNDPATNAATFQDGNSNCYYKDVALSPNVAELVQRVRALEENQDASLSITGQIKKWELFKIIDAINGASSDSKVTLDMSGVTGISVIPERAFQNCQHLKQIILPEEITSIERGAFSSCNDLESIYLPASLTSVIIDAFDYSYKLESLNVAEGNSKYSSEGGVLFSKDKKTLILCPFGKETYSIPSGVKTIGENAFFNHMHTRELTIPNTVESIGESAFLGTAITSLVIPASVTSIGKDIVRNCHQLNSVEFKAPSGWNRTETKLNWENRTNGEDYNFSATDFAQNATKLKFNDTGDWADYYWYKSTQN